MADRTNSKNGTSQPRFEFRMAHLMVGFVAAVLLPVLILTSVLAFQLANNAKETEQRRIASVAVALRNAVDQMLASQLRTGWAVASAQSLQDGDLPTFYQTARRAAENAGGHFVLIDRSGQQVINTRVPEGSDLPRTADPVAAKTVMDDNKAAIGNIGPGAVAKGPLYSVRIPVQIGPEVKFVLSYVPEMSVAVHLFDQLYLPDGWFAAIMDGNGTIVARSQKHEEFVGRPVDQQHRALMRELPDYAEAIDKEGRSVAVSTRSSQISPWGVVVGVPLDTLQTPVRAVVLRFGLLGATALLVSLVAAYFGGKLLQRPTKRLADAANEMGHSDHLRIEPFLSREANQIAMAMETAHTEIKHREEALKRSEGHLKLAMREMSHRALNLLSVIQALSKQTAITSASMEEFTQRFASRLSGLAQSHRLLIEADWTSVEVRDLAKSQMSGFGRAKCDQVTFSGEPFEVNAAAAQILGMAFHELATNATKHGALSDREGHVFLHWEVDLADTGPVLELTWEENSPRIASENARTGFGSFLLNEAVAMQLDGTSSMDWTPGTMVWKLRVPVVNLKPTENFKFAAHGDAEL